METSYIVYDHDENLKHKGGKWIKGTTENLAVYIAGIEDTHTCVVTDVNDNLVLCTIGNMVDRCMDKKLLKELIPILVPYQIGLYSNKELPEVIYA